MVQQGLGIACLPDLLIAQHLTAGTLRTVLDDYVAHTGVMRVLWPSSRHLSPKLRAFVDFMGERFLA
jgi:DNA-binding transcriptional LysR family regulator